MVVPWQFHGSAMAVHDSDMAASWQPQGLLVAVPWQSHGSSMAVPWLSHGSLRFIRTAFTSSKVRPIKFEDCLRIGDGDWWGKRRDRAAVETCDLCRRELWRSRDRARPLVQLGCWGNRRRRGRPRTQCWWGGVSPLYYLASCVCLLEPAPSL